jgi:PIF1-like helicase
MNTETYSSYDSLKENDGLNEEISLSMKEYLLLFSESGVPPSTLKLKIGVICSIMRNLSLQNGLVKNARVRILEFKSNSIKVCLLNEPAVHFWLPRITFEFQPERCPWTIIRRQFPLRPAYATTFNSCQGLTLDRVVIDLRTPVFAHGQLYTALSRCRNRNNCRVLISTISKTHHAHELEKDNESTEYHSQLKEVLNIVYKSLL